MISNVTHSSADRLTGIAAYIIPSMAYQTGVNLAESMAHLIGISLVGSPIYSMACNIGDSFTESAGIGNHIGNSLVGSPSTCMAHNIRNRFAESPGIGHHIWVSLT